MNNTSANLTLDDAVKLENDYCMNVFGATKIAFTHGEGIYLYDTDNKEYMDMIGGIAVNSLGHNNKALVSAIQNQAQKLIHCCNYYVIPERAKLAQKLCNLSFADKCFFSNSGAEANEAAIKLARGYFYYKGSTKRNIITAKMSFHGRTLATINATGQEKFRKPFGPDCPGFDYTEFNNIEDLKSKINSDTAAVMLELIQGESGVRPADIAYAKAVRKLCDENDILLIIDEVQTGIGRTGKMFCYENYGITPDIMTLAKGLGGGVPIGATLATDKVATGFKIGDHGSTFGGNPLCTECANVVLDEIINNNLLENVVQNGKLITSLITELKDKYKSIKQIRGMGLLIGIEFDDTVVAKNLRNTLMNNGVLVSAIGTSVIRIAPPLIITEEQSRKFVTTLEKAIEELVQ